MGARIPAEVFPPGEFLKDELEARGWTQAEFAEIIGKDARLVSEVISGKRSITPETAIALGAALGTSPELWMNLEGQYQLSKVRPKEDSIARKADLHGRFPVREMVKRGWLEATKSVDVLQQQLIEFFGIEEIGQTPQLRYAAKATTYQEVPVAQVAWFCRAKRLAAYAPTATNFSSQRLVAAKAQLSEQLAHVDGTQRVPGILAQAGIRFVIVEAIAGSKIDGACFWLDKKNPVIAMTMRFDRVDNFWHTLFHELDHVGHEEGQAAPILDIDIMDNDSGKPDIEARANENAAEALIPKKEMDGFVARVNPMFSEEQIVGFARRIAVHPGLVVGQLQNRGLIPWSFHRKYLEKVREYVVANAVTDGFGHRVIESSSMSGIEMTTKNEQLQFIVEEYRRADNKWPATMREVAAWAISANLWAPQPSAVIAQCAEELSRALRDEYVTDPQGRRIRTKHAATYTNDEGEQLVLWDDIRTAPADHMRRAFQQRRHQILGDCKQLKSDVDSFNQNRQPPEPIQIVFDFTLDLEEAAYLKRSA